MTLAIAGILIAFVLGALRAVELRRIGGRIEVVNVVVVSAFANQRGAQIPKLLRASGPSVYLQVASAIAEAALRFQTEQPAAESSGLRRDELVTSLERDARAALISATRRLRKYSWLDTLTVVSLGYAGIQLAIYGGASTMLALGLVAGTLLWLANVLGVRHIARRLAVGASALIESLHRALEALPVEATSNDPHPG